MADEFAAQRAQRMGSSLCTTVDLSMPERDQIFMTPSSEALNISY